MRSAKRIPSILSLSLLILLLTAGAAADIPAPPDVAQPPEDAQKTESGLISKILEAGSGEVHPKATDTVEVHYTGWTTDGKMFDSSVTRGETASFPLNREAHANVCNFTLNADTLMILPQQGDSARVETIVSDRFVEQNRKAREAFDMTGVNQGDSVLDVF